MFFAASSACRFKLASTYYTRYVLPAKSGAISPSCHVPCMTKPAAIAFGLTYRSVVVIPLSWYISDKTVEELSTEFTTKVRSVASGLTGYMCIVDAEFDAIGHGTFSSCR